MGYKILGYAVWNGMKWYFRTRYAGGGGRRLAAAGVVAVAVAGLAVAGSRRAAS